MKTKSSFSALQKTYDQSHLKCSYAIHHESTGNETEALRYWRQCLSQLQESAPAPNFKPSTNAEKALVHNYISLQNQCEERVALLQAILVSRVEAQNAGVQTAGDSGLGVPLALPPRTRSPSPDRRFLSTLRPGQRKPRRQSEYGERPVAAASQAASMAWTGREAGGPGGGGGAEYSREDGAGTPTVRRRPGVGTLKTRPQSSMLPLGSPTQFEPPPPPPPHRIPVVARKPVPRPTVPKAYTTTGRIRVETEYLPRRSASEHPHTHTPPASPLKVDSEASSSSTDSLPSEPTPLDTALASLPASIDPAAARQVANEILHHGDTVHWSDVAGLHAAKSTLKETVVYPFLRPDLFLGLREPARGLLLFGPPGTGKTMLARAVATESHSTFFSISASSLTSKYLGESEKLVRALFALAKALAPSIIFVDEIDSLLSARGGSGEHEATTRIKTEFLIQWSDLARAAAQKDSTAASRVLVLAATNLPWAIDDAARRRFVRRQYIPLPEPETRQTQIENLLASQKHDLDAREMDELVRLTDGFSGSDITALAKDAAMGPLRALGDRLLMVPKEEIRGIRMEDFRRSLESIRPSVGKEGLKRFEDWAEKFGERGG